ncbi:hypothetical protein BCY84_01206 [Trypanosoma cruzi cruzi]|nr:hypothetical protein BCY84_01206 [Trypanosoma cruzi cruzi]
MLHRSLLFAARRTRPVYAPAARKAAPAAGRKVDPKDASGIPQASKVNGATGPDGDSLMDKVLVTGCLGAVAGWFIFGPPIKSHH